MLLRIWDITLSVSNLERAVDFYENILGLSIKYYFPENYAGLDCGGIEIGLTTGVSPQSSEGIPCVNFLVKDCDALVRSLHEQGVHFIKETQDAAWGGRIARFMDPDGNLLQITQIDWKKYFSASAKA